MFAGLQTTKSVADGLNIEMGRKIKNANSKGGGGGGERRHYRIVISR